MPFGLCTKSKKEDVIEPTEEMSDKPKTEEGNTEKACEKKEKKCEKKEEKK